jgi:hypothetical protein
METGNKLDILLVKNSVGKVTKMMSQISGLLKTVKTPVSKYCHFGKKIQIKNETIWLYLVPWSLQ